MFELEQNEMYEHREKIISKLNVIQITKENLDLFKEEELMFIEESKEGTDYIMDKDANLYDIPSYISFEDVFSHLPDYKNVTSENQKVYTVINLGLGHALFIKTSIYEKYMKLLKSNIQYENPCEDCYTAYCYWMENAITFLNEYN